jgi:hypothetical protein
LFCRIFSLRGASHGKLTLVRGDRSMTLINDEKL